MASVTRRIKEIKQPRGGYINPRTFVVTAQNDGIELNDEENVHSSIVGLAVDYLTRFTSGASPKEAFKISLRGADIANESSFANKLLDNVSGLDNLSITNACKLSGFDVCFRMGMMGYKPADEINPNGETIENIRIMVERSLKFITKYGPIVKDGFTFDGAYNDTISTGDGDFLTKDTLWDFKTSKKEPTSAHTLQLLIYSIMGKRSIHEEFKSIGKLGVYNPRINKVYLLDISAIPTEVIAKVSSEVIGY